MAIINISTAESIPLQAYQAKVYQEEKKERQERPWSQSWCSIFGHVHIQGDMFEGNWNQEIRWLQSNLDTQAEWRTSLLDKTTHLLYPGGTKEGFWFKNI